MSNNPIQRTVSFWRVLRSSDRSPVEPADWEGVLTKWGHQSTHGPVEHEIEGGDVLRGKIFTHENIDHLVLTKGRDDVPRQQHLGTGEVAEVPVDGEEWQVIESSFVSFLDFGNVFGLMRSAGASPSPQAIAK